MAIEDDAPAVEDGPWPADETPAEALLDILRSAIDVGQSIGGLTDDEIREVLETLLDREAERERSKFRVT